MKRLYLAACALEYHVTMRFAATILVLLAGHFASGLPSTSAESVEWPQWRGPAHDGIYPDEREWSASWGKDGPRLAWKMAVGTGYATAAISDGRVYTVGRPEGADDIVYCINDQTGKPIWTKGCAQDLVALYNAGSRPVPQS